MLSVDISDFSANLLEYLEQANAGAQICITTNGKSIATIGLYWDQPSKQPLNERLVNPRYQPTGFYFDLGMFMIAVTRFTVGLR